MTWRNWAGDQVCAPVSVHRPASRDELVDVVAHEAAAGRRVRVPGSGHSFSSVAMTDGAMVHVDALNRVLDVDVATGQVTVEAGIVLADLNAALHRHGLALPNLGDIDKQTIAGAIATATHGTGAGHRNISAQVVALDVVTAAGEVVTLDRGDDLLAGRVHLGALGAVVAVTLQAVPAFRLHRVDTPRPLVDVLDGFDELAAAHDHLEFYVFPYTDRALTITRDRTDLPAAPRGRVAEFVAEELVQHRLADLMFSLTKLRPALIPSASRLAARLLGEGEYVDDSFRVFSSERRIRFTEMEYAVPLDQGPDAVRAVLDLIERDGIETAMPIECRVVAGDDALLSPTHDRDSFYVAVHQYRGMPWEPYFRAVEQILFDLGGRPHWGKRHHLDAAAVRERYPRLDDFLAVRDRLDPDRVFTNAYTSRMLGA